MVTQRGIITEESVTTKISIIIQESTITRIQRESVITERSIIIWKVL